MAERDYKATPVSDVLGLRTIIRDLSGDLADLRSGQITPVDALARAALAKQIWNGVRLYLATGKDSPVPPGLPRSDEAAVALSGLHIGEA